jgi:L-asparaginase
MPATGSARTPRVTVFGLGGTIAMTAGGAGGVVPGLSVGQLLAAIPALAALRTSVDVVDFRSRPGASLTFDDLEQLGMAVRQRIAEGVDGVVVTQGTDTIEETAYLLDLRHHGAAPVVVTGAMRNPTLPGADGPANLLAAISVAADPVVRDLGCLVVFADEIHAAGRVRKSHSTSPATFQSPNGGPLGYVVEGRARLLNRPTGRYRVPPPVSSTAPRVGLRVVSLDDEGAALDAPAVRLDGLVVAGFGAGHVPSGWVPPLAALAARIPVVLASRASGGPVLSATYGFPGSEMDLLGRGLIPAGLLDPYKARILLRAVLAAGADRAQITAAFQAAAGLGDPAAWPWSPPVTGPDAGR